MRIAFFLSILLSTIYLQAIDETAPIQGYGLLTNLDSEPSGIVDGCVNVISGEFFDYEVDAVVPGPEPLVIARILQNNNPHVSAYFNDRFNKDEFPSWHHSDDSYVTVKSKSKKHEYAAEYQGRCGERLFFTLNDKQTMGEYHNKFLRHGVTNTSRGIIGAQTNPLNNTMTWKKDKEVHLETAEGTSLDFKKEDHGRYVLIQEKLANGLITTYETKKKKKSVKLANANGVLSKYDLEESHHDVVYHSEGQKLVDEHYEKIDIKDSSKSQYCLTTVKRFKLPQVDYDWKQGEEIQVFDFYPHKFASEPSPRDRERSKNRTKEREKEDRPPPPSPLPAPQKVKITLNPKIKKKSYPDSRFKNISYYKKGPNEVGGTIVNVDTYNHDSFQKVKFISAPLGVDYKPIIKFQFIYSYPQGYGKEGNCKVIDAKGNATKYFFTSRQRLHKIIKYKADQTPYCEENLFWGERDKRDTPKEILLDFRTFGKADLQEKIYCRRYSYDNKGNVLDDYLYGNLTGTSTVPLIVDGSGKSNAECFVKTYTYYNDKCNSLHTITEGAITRAFTYKPNTDLVESCLHSTSQGIFLRHFYEYDVDGMVTKHIVDDGTSADVKNLTEVTERKVETISRRDRFPFGLPEVIKEEYLENGFLKQSLCKINTYDDWGRLEMQTTYDANNKKCFSENWTYYEDHDNVKTYTNALNETTEYYYDDNHNKMWEKLPNGLLRRFEYDYMNRLVATKEEHEDITISTSTRYDKCSNPISTVDVFGNETVTDYDEFNRPIKITGPPVEGYESITQYAYDEMSNPILITDALGHQTAFKYNIYGKPSNIKYPDGSEEKFEYDLQGRLVKEIAKNGTTTKYTLDAQGRITKREVLDANDALLYDTRCEYNTFHFLSEKDPAGNITSYTYDAQGRKTSVKKGDLVTTYDYDSLGRIEKVSNGESVQTYEYDFLNRVVEECTKTPDGKVLLKTRFGYDTDGHKIWVEQDTASGPALTQTKYDTHGIPMELTDPEGNVSISKLCFDYLNARGQRVMCIELTDPLGQLTQTIHDSQGRIVEVIKMNSFGDTIQQTCNSYNPDNKCTKTVHKIFPTGSVQETHFEYDSLNRLIVLTQAAGSPDEKKTYTNYNLYGEKTTLTKPDGTVIHYTYDALGRLSSMKSNDLHYQYTYDLNSNLIQVDNLKTNGTTIRDYDIFGHVIRETLETGFTTHMTYNHSGALATLTLPDDSSVHYSYEGPFLKIINRFNENGDLKYTHTYSSYDHSGNLLEGSFINNIGTYHMTYTRKGEHKTRTAPFFSEELSYDQAGNLSERNLTLNESTKQENFSYDSLYQLTNENNHTYSYDSLYNRLSKDNHPYTLNSLNQILSDHENIYTYDLNGNLTNINNIKLTYDSLDRLISYDNTAFQYDPFNRLLSYTEDNQTYYILYVAQNDIGTFSNDTITSLRILGTGLGAEIGATIAIEIDNITFAPLHDHIGNIIALYAPEGSIVESYQYTAYGEEDPTPSINPWHFASKRTLYNLTLFGNRFYNPAIGRFLTPDPIGYSGGPNLYAYVLNSPLTHFDSYGNFDQSPSLWERTKDYCSRAWESVKSYGRECFSRVRDGFSRVREGISKAGRTISKVSKDVIPFPIIREATCFVGHFMEHRTYKNYVPEWSGEHSNAYYLTGAIPNEKPLNAYVYVNGICTESEEAIAVGKTGCELYNASLGISIHNAHHGLAPDLLDCLLIKFNVYTNATDKAVQALKYTIAASGGINSGAKIRLECFSRGAIIIKAALHRLSKEEKNMIHLTAYGPGSFINDPDLAYCKNIISTGDLIPALGDPYNYACARLGLRPNVTFIKSNRIEHSINCDTYQKARLAESRLFRKKGQ